jgi:4-amino-4-deoxy-L-arabinose transferase-like glycosyltransferase
VNALFHPLSSPEKPDPLELGDVPIALGLVLLASLLFWTTPRLASDLMIDAPDYALPAVNLLERGRLALFAYGHVFPQMHPPGMSLLLLPSYILFGHLLGNGIYAVLLCAIGTIAVTYIIGVKLGGRLCGCSAALFLMSNYGFWQFSKKIMSEVPTTFFGVVVLALCLTIRNWKRPGLVCLAIGAIIGFAVSIRNDNILLLAPAALLLSWEGTRQVRLQRLVFSLVGLAPFLVALAAYNQVTFGHPWQTGYRYWGGAGSVNKPGFSVRYITKSGFMQLQQIKPATNEVVYGNATIYLSSLLNQADTTQIFCLGTPKHRPLTYLYQAEALLRTALGAIGLLACLVGWQTNSLRHRFLLWLATLTCAYISFFSMYYYRDERFLLRLVPVFCLVNGLGVAALYEKWASWRARSAVLLFVGAQIMGFILWDARIGLPPGEQFENHQALTFLASKIETNAVIVSNFNPFLVDAYLIHGTGRIAIPLGTNAETKVFINNDSTPTILSPFSASRDPERLRELLHSGLPVYWLIDRPWLHLPASDDYSELNTLAESFDVLLLGTVEFRSEDYHPFFGRIVDKPQ